MQHEPRLAFLKICAWALLALPLVATAQAPRWGYEGEYGPAQWGRLSPKWALCERGQRQSPVDIVSARPVQGQALRFEYQRAPLRIVNDGHTVRVRFADKSRLLIGGQVHRLQQFHFHLPGGDRLRGEGFPMAMHFLHKSAAGQLVSLVVLFRQGAENAALAALLPQMPAQGQPERAFPDVQVDPSHLLPASQAYFAYDGSLTAPPCTEGVRWIVMQQPLEASAAQLAQLRALFPANARPVQPLHGRDVTSSP
jgi:carbonic anhydrase